MITFIPRSLAVATAALLSLAACGPTPSTDWAPVTVAGLTLDSPGRLVQIGTEVPAAMDPAVRAAVQRIDSYGRSVGQAEVRVSRVVYQPTAVLSLRGAAQGAVDAVRGNPASGGLTHTHVAAETSGIPAIRTSTRFTVRDNPALGEMLTVLRGQTLWQVQVLGPAGPETETLARRVMDSVRLEPEPA